ncbi:unnamed protein product, partial [Ectocarpus sp. 12 AP-2014]
DEKVKIWDVATGKCLRTMASHSEPVTAAAFNADGTGVVSGSADGLIRLWDSSTGACLKTIFAEGNPSVSFSTFSPNGKYVLAGTLDDSLRLWQIGHDTKCVKTYKGHVNRRYSVTACFDGNKRVVSG